MVDDYLSDREQEDALRSWWRENWRWIIGGVVLGVALLAGWRYYEGHQERIAREAAQLYDELQTAVAKPDVAAANAVLAKLASDYASSGYTQQGRLRVAKAHVDAGKYDDAMVLLRAVADQVDDRELAQIARLRMARLLIQQGKHEDALALLDTESAGEFAAQVREIRGDALFAKDDHDGARAEYAAALADAADAHTDRTLLELKLRQVGGAASPPESQGLEK